MRWSCPHCGTQLAIQDEKVSTSWSFSRCYKCAGFALIRKSDTNLIKVDRAPAGENVVLPEAHEEPAGTLSRAATQNLNRILDKAAIQQQSAPKKAAKPVVRPAPTAAARQVPKPAAIQPTPPALAAPSGPASTAAPRFPDPLPPEPETVRPRSPRALQWAVAATGLMAIGSGVYLYVQGQQLWEKARARSAARSALTAPALAKAAATVPSAPLLASAATEAKPLDPEIPKPEIFEHLRYTDQVHARAMAPARPAPPAAVPPAAVSPVAGAMLIQINESTANLRAGPGAEFPIVAMARPNRAYPVVEWKQRWFKIEYDPTGPKTAWIRNDLTKADTSKR